MAARAPSLKPRATALAVRALLFGGALAASLPVVAGSKEEAALAERLARVERSLNGSGLLEMARQIEALQQEVRQLRGEIENQAFTLEQVRKSQREAYADADRRIGALEQGSATANGAPADPALSTLDSPSDAPVAGKPSDQTMTVDIESPAGAVAPQAPGDAIDASPEAAEAMRPPGERRTVVLSPGDPASGEMRITQNTPAEPGRAPAAAAPGGDPLLAPAPSSEAAAPTAAAAPMPRSETPESENAYREAFGLLKGGQYEQAIAGFTAYLKNYPNGQYADNAQFWIGESYYVLRKFEPAISQYQKLITNYPDSQKQPQALLKIANSFAFLGRKDQATQILNQLKQKYPDSTAARLADESLARLRGDQAN